MTEEGARLEVVEVEPEPKVLNSKRNSGGGSSRRKEAPGWLRTGPLGPSSQASEGSALRGNHRPGKWPAANTLTSLGSLHLFICFVL